MCIDLFEQEGYNGMWIVEVTVLQNKEKDLPRELSSTFRRRGMTMTSWGAPLALTVRTGTHSAPSSIQFEHMGTSCIQLVSPFSILHDDDDDVDGTTLFVSIFRSVLHFVDMSHDPCGVVRLPLASSSSSSCSSATITGTTTTTTTTSCSTTLM